MKNFGFWAIISGLFAVVFIAAFVITTINFVLNISVSEREFLISGSTIHISESGNQHIYIEDAAPPTLNFHRFTFTDTATGSVFVSTPPAFPSTYSLDSLIMRGEVIRGTFGRIVSSVHLDEGYYIIDFEPYAGTGSFVLNVDLFVDAGPFVFRIVAISLGLCASIGGLVVFLVLRSHRKAKNHLQERHWQ